MSKTLQPDPRLIREQFQSILGLFFIYDPDNIDWSVHDTQLADWYRRFDLDIACSNRGYPTGQKVLQTPQLEDEVLEFGLKQGLSRKPLRPATLCLSHDVDNLFPTWIFWAKQLVSQKRFLFRLKRDNYLSAIERVLRLDSDFLPAGMGSTFFVFNAARLPGLKNRLTQFLIDPAYSKKDSSFQELLPLLRKHGCEVGLHGGILSLEPPFQYASEKASLEEQWGERISMGRQHWLHLPENKRSLERIHSAGIQVDSTLGWNGKPGFRCGMARPFPIHFHSGARLLEMPLLLMDRPLFDGMKLSTQGVVETAIRFLDQVFERNGCVSINWHEAVGHDDFPWFDAYEKILIWARSRGFQFRNLSSGLALHHLGETLT